MIVTMWAYNTVRCIGGWTNNAGLLNAGQIIHGIQLTDRYNTELLRIEYKDYVVNAGAFGMHGQPVPA